METITRKEQDNHFYNDRYKYGYDWSCYYKLGCFIIDIMVKLGINQKKTIDVGCGWGWFTDMLYFNISKNITGIDFSEKAINFYSRKLYPAINFEVANIYDYDYKGFEIITLIEVMEHIEKDIELLNKFDKDSKIFVTVPYQKERNDIAHVREYDINSVYARYGEVMDIKFCEKYEQFIFFWGVKK